MNIAFFIGSLGGGGAERVVCNLSNHLIRKGHKIEILTMSDANAGYELDEAVKKTCLLNANERKNIIVDNSLRVIRFIKHMKSNCADCYVVMLPETTILMLLFRKCTKAKVVAAERVDPNSYSWIKKSLIKKIAHNADRWVFQTEDIKKWYKNVVEDEKGVVIPNAINEVFIRQPYNGKKEKRIVGIGRLTDQKNFSLLIDSFSMIADDFPDYSLVIYGEGAKRKELEEKVRKLKLTNRVALPGYVDDIVEQLEKSTLFVLSSDYEGMPNALMEAMALGLPCISTDCGGGGARFLIEEGKNGLIVPVNDACKLGTAIRIVLTNKDLRDTIANNAKKITDQLSPTVIYGKWEQVIVNVKGNRL